MAHSRQHCPTQSDIDTSEISEMSYQILQLDINEDKGAARFYDVYSDPRVSSSFFSDEVWENSDITITTELQKENPDTCVILEELKELIGETVDFQRFLASRDPPQLPPLSEDAKTCVCKREITPERQTYLPSMSGALPSMYGADTFLTVSMNLQAFPEDPDLCFPCNLLVKYCDGVLVHRPAQESKERFCVSLYNVPM